MWEEKAKQLRATTGELHELLGRALEEARDVQLARWGPSGEGAADEVLLFAIRRFYELRAIIQELERSLAALK